jgi:hypothetical protein
VKKVSKITEYSTLLRKYFKYYPTKMRKCVPQKMVKWLANKE